MAMSFKFQALKKGIKEGHVAFKVISYEEKQSSKGDDMVSVQIDVVDDNGVIAKIFENFLLTEKSVWRFGQFLESIGKGEVYESGSVNKEDVEGGFGHCEIKRVANDQKDSKYTTKLVVVRFFEKVAA